MLKPLFILSTVSFLVVAPWVVRCSLIHGRFVFLSSVSGRTLHEGNWVPFDSHDIMLEARRKGLDEVGMDNLIREATVAWLKEHPGHAARSAVRRVGDLWTWRNIKDEKKYFFRPLERSESGWKKAVLVVGHLGFFASRALSYLGLLGMLVAIKRARELSLLYALPLWLTLFHFLSFIGIPRYLVPAYPALAIFAAMFVMESRGRFFRRGQEKS